MVFFSFSIVVATAILALAVFTARFRAARRIVWKLQEAKVPMPTFHPVLGHLKVLKECLQELPKNCTVHVAMQHLSRRFPQGVFYIDLWPFSKTLMVVGSPMVANQIENASLSKPLEIVQPLEILSGGPSLVTMHGDVHRKWRNLFNPGFSTGYMTTLAPSIAEEVLQYCNLLSKRAKEGKMFQIEEMTLRLTFDVIGHVALDANMNYQTRDNPLADSLRTVIYWTQFSSTFNPIKRYLSPRPIVQWWHSRRMNGYLETEIEKRFDEHQKLSNKPQKNSKSVISLALDTYLSDPETFGPPSKEVFTRIAIPQLRVFMHAGHDTTASTILYSYYLLSKHPKVLAQLRTEHDEIFGPNPSPEHISNLITENPKIVNQVPYTSAFIKEVLRYFPPSGSLREGRPDLTLVDEAGNRYPTEGCHIWTLMLVLHHNPLVWTRPTEFLPERWLVGPEDPLYPVKGAWRAFEFGPRNCIGQTLALLEIRIALIMTVRKFDIVPAYEEWDALHPSRGVRTVEGNRMYQVEMGGGGAHPADAFPCRVSVRS